ncbi:hypothetical protein GO280_05040 [Ralstonia solanacearum]|nr:hypothetical protein [Ralstonia solanacearum]
MTGRSDTAAGGAGGRRLALRVELGERRLERLGRSHRRHARAARRARLRGGQRHRLRTGDRLDEGLRCARLAQRAGAARKRRERARLQRHPRRGKPGGRQQHHPGVVFRLDALGRGAALAHAAAEMHALALAQRLAQLQHRAELERHGRGKDIGPRLRDHGVGQRAAFVVADQDGRVVARHLLVGLQEAAEVFQVAVGEGAVAQVGLEAGEQRRCRQAGHQRALCRQALRHARGRARPALVARQHQDNRPDLARGLVDRHVAEAAVRDELHRAGRGGRRGRRHDGQRQHAAVGGLVGGHGRCAHLQPGRRVAGGGHGRHAARPGQADRRHQHRALHRRRLGRRGGRHQGQCAGRRRGTGLRRMRPRRYRQAGGHHPAERGTARPLHGTLLPFPREHCARLVLRHLEITPFRPPPIRAATSVNVNSGARPPRASR